MEPSQETNQFTIITRKELYEPDSNTESMLVKINTNHLDAGVNNGRKNDLHISRYIYQKPEIPFEEPVQSVDAPDAESKSREELDPTTEINRPRIKPEKIKDFTGYTYDKPVNPMKLPDRLPTLTTTASTTKRSTTESYEEFPEASARIF